jgi:hypothetical protein
MVSLTVLPSYIASPQTPLTAKRPIKGLWGRTDNNDIGEGPSKESSRNAAERVPKSFIKVSQ